jgi:hypothetical protein
MAMRIEQSVIEMLTAWATAAAEMPDADADPPAELMDAIRAPAQYTGSISVKYSRDPVPLAEVRGLLADAVEQATQTVETHYAKVIAYMAFLFSRLADEAPAAGAGFDLAEFLQRQALWLASQDTLPGDGTAPGS